MFTFFNTLQCGVSVALGGFINEFVTQIGDALGKKRFKSAKAMVRASIILYFLLLAAVNGIMFGALWQYSYYTSSDKMETEMRYVLP